MNYDLIIVDAPNYAHRVNYVQQHLHNSCGIKTGMYHGFLSFLISLDRDYPKALKIICWDAVGLKKKQMNSDYKSDRQKSKTDFYNQVNVLKELITIYGAWQCQAYGIEADDVAARIVRENSDKNILLISNDSDWIMMMNDRTVVNRNGNFYNKKEYMNLLEVSSIEEYHLFLALTGSHNNIKGIPYLDKKKTKNLIILCENNIDKLFEIPELTDSLENIRKKIKENEETIRKNYELIKFIYDGYEIEKIKPKKDLKKLIDEIKQYELKQVIKRLEGIIETEKEDEGCL